MEEKSAPTRRKRSKSLEYLRAAVCKSAKLRQSIDAPQFGSSNAIQRHNNSFCQMYNDMLQYAKVHFSPGWENTKSSKWFLLTVASGDLNFGDETTGREFNDLFELEHSLLSRGVVKVQTIIAQAQTLAQMLQEAYAFGEEMGCFFKEFESDKNWNNMYEHLSRKLTKVLFEQDQTVCDNFLGVWNNRFRDLIQSAPLYTVFEIIIQHLIPDKKDQERACEGGRTTLFNEAFRRVHPEKLEHLKEATAAYIRTWAKGKADVFVARLLTKENPVQPTGRFLEFLETFDYMEELDLTDDLDTHCKILVDCEFNGATHTVCEEENSYLCDEGTIRPHTRSQARKESVVKIRV